MFAIGKLLAILSAMIVVPTISYVLGETTFDMGNPPPPPAPPALEERQMDRKRQEQFFGGPNTQGMPKPMDDQNGFEKDIKFFGDTRQNGNFQKMMEGQDGPSDEEMEKRQKEMEKRQIEQQKQQLERMKKEVSQNLKRPITMITSKMASLEKKGIAVPASIKEFVASIQNALAQLQSATEFEEAETAMDTLRESEQEFHEYFQTLEMAGNWPRILSQAKSALKREERSLTNYIRQSKRKGALDIGEPLGVLSEGIIKLKSTLVSAEEQVKTGEIDEAMSALQDDFFGAMDDLRDTKETITILTNLTGHLSQAPRQLKLYESQLKRLKSKKIVTTEADSILVELKGALSQIQVLAKAKPLDADAVTAAVEEGSALIEKFEETVSELSGTISSNDKLFQVNKQSIPTFDVDPDKE